MAMDTTIMPPTLLPLVSYDLTLDGKPEPFWKVDSVWISEAINEPCRASLDVSTDAEIDTDALLGASAVLSIHRGTSDPQFMCGLVAQIDYLGVTHDVIHLRLQLVSAFELLRQEVDSRIWQATAPLDIIKEVLEQHFGPYSRTLDVGQITRGGAVREYCVQYRESVFDFVSRLLEEEGISYTFVHDGEQQHEVLTLFDDNGQYPPIATDDEMFAADTLPIVDHNPSNVSYESLQGIEWSRSLTPTATLRRDFDWKNPESLLSAKADGTDERGRTRRVYTHTDRRFESDDLELRAKDSRAAGRLRDAVCHGHGNATVLRPGRRFKVAGEVRGDLAQEYIIVSIQHSGQPQSAGDYTNNFECVPSDAEIRPRQATPKPRAHGPHTAIVTGDDEIHTDKHGRIQVQFAWEEQVSYEAGSSCWIRCAQSWAGQGWGAQFIPRVGMEVVVEFLEGNPDRPLVVGCVYDGTREHPFTVPDVKTQSGWRTRSSPNSEGFNELRFEDAAGSEEVYLHAQRNLRAEIEADESRSVGAARSTTIAGDDTLVVSEGNVQVTIKKGKRTSEISEGDDELTIKQGGSSKKVPLGTELIDAKDVSIKAKDSLTLECGGSTITMTPSEIKLVSAMIKLN